MIDQNSCSGGLSYANSVYGYASGRPEIPGVLGDAALFDKIVSRGIDCAEDAVFSSIRNVGHSEGIRRIGSWILSVPSGVALAYFAAHGVEGAEGLCLLSRESEDQWLLETSISFEWLMSQFASRGDVHFLVLFDCCREFAQDHFSEQILFVPQNVSAYLSCLPGESTLDRKAGVPLLLAESFTKLSDSENTPFKIDDVFEQGGGLSEEGVHFGRAHSKAIATTSEMVHLLPFDLELEKMAIRFNVARNSELHAILRIRDDLRASTQGTRFGVKALNDNPLVTLNCRKLSRQSIPSILDAVSVIAVKVVAISLSVDSTIERNRRLLKAMGFSANDADVYTRVINNGVVSISVTGSEFYIMMKDRDGNLQEADPQHEVVRYLVWNIGR